MKVLVAFIVIIYLFACAGTPPSDDVLSGPKSNVQPKCGLCTLICNYG